jgi:hypothetical protein
MMPLAGPQFNSMNYGYMNGAAYGPGVGMGYMDMPQMQQHPPQMAEPVGFDAEAFERAFDAASAEMHQREREADPLVSEAAVVHFNMHDTDVATFEINKTRLHESTISPEPLLQQQYEQQEEQEAQKTDPDALAQTAGQLLQSVSQETSEKFAQSSFLALMRRLRDKEVVVEGENFIEVSTISVEGLHVANSLISHLQMLLPTQLAQQLKHLKNRKVC